MLLKCAVQIKVHIQHLLIKFAFLLIPIIFISASLKGAKVLVTGASSGIGEQMAYHYARFGAQIVITARREKVLQQVSSRLFAQFFSTTAYFAI